MASMASSKSSSARDKLRVYLLQNVGRVCVSGELRKVAGGISEWARRVRELRNEEGYTILTHNDRSELKPGEYVLESAIPTAGFARTISQETRALVLDRDGFTCQMCGVAAGEPHPDNSGRKARMHLGHIVDKSMGGSDEPSNFRTLCSVCNEGARNLTLDRPTLQKLLVQVRRATGTDQLGVLKWLLLKYPTQAREILADG